MKLHSKRLGVKKAKRILVTGGASTSQPILQVISDVFDLPVYTVRESNSAAMGAAIRAAHGLKCEQFGKFMKFSEISRNPQYSIILQPTAESDKIYGPLIKRYEVLETKIFG